jgi:hypothetical protein
MPQTGPRTSLTPRHIAMADKMSEELRDQVFDDTLILAILFGIDRSPDENSPKVNQIIKAMGVSQPVKEMEDADLIQFPLRYGTSTNSTAFTGLQPLPTNMDEGLARAWMDWAIYTDYCALPWTDEIRNAGATRLINRHKAQLETMYSSLGELMEQDIVAGTQGDTVEGSQNKLPSLSNLVSATTATGIRQNVNSATYTWWRTQYDTCAVFATTGLDDLNDMHNACSSRAGLRGPDLHLTTRDNWRRYVKQAEGIHRVTEIGEVDLKIGLAYYGGKPVLQYSLVPATYWWMLSMKALRAYIHRDANFIGRHPVSPNNLEIGLQTRCNAALQYGSIEQRHHGLLAIAS